jgi:hypothetical protein
VDHLAGGAFGLLRGWVTCSIVYVALTAFPVRLDMVERAVLAPYLLQGAQLLSYVTSDDVQKRFLDGYNQVQERWKAMSTKSEKTR